MCLRGPTMVVLLWYKDKRGRIIAVFVRQSRVAVGLETWEVPSGFADRSGLLRGAAFERIQKETGLVVHVQDLVYLSESPVVLSSFTDEHLELFCMQVSHELCSSSSSTVAAFDVEADKVRKDVKLLALLETTRLAKVFRF